MIECPNCGGNLKFNIPLQQMHCDFCASSFDPYDFDEKDKDGVERADYDTTIFTCPECGGEIESTDTDITGFCPFCGGATIFYQRLQKELKPDYILPFTITKEQCKARYAEKAKRNIFMPKEFRDINYIDGFRAIYMPYWSYDIDQRGPIKLKGETSHRSGDYIIHDHFKLTGDMDAFYHGINYDASSSFSDDISNELAPFNVKMKKPFTAGFLSGFYADTSDVSPDLYQSDVLNFAANTSADKIKKIPEFKKYTINDAHKGIWSTTRVSKTQRTLFPVWFMSYRKGDRVAYATVNGQTGKVSADFPIDLKRFYAIAGIIALAIFVLLNLLLTLKPRTTTALALIMSMVTLILYFGESSQIKKRNLKSDDRGYQARLASGAAKNDEKYEKRGTKALPSICIFASLFISLIAAIGPTVVQDYFYYTIDIISAVLMGVTLSFLIKDYNILATRPLPQFEKRGGDDNA